MSLFGNLSANQQRGQTQTSQPSCRHELCYTCITKLQQSWKATLDLQRISKDMHKDIPVVVLTQLCTQKTDDWAMCPTHGEKRDLFCLEHKTAVCSHCKIFGDCQNHKVKPVREIQPQADEKKKEMERIAENLMMAHSELTQLIAEKRKTLENLLKEFPAPQELDGKFKLFELSVELEALFTKESSMLDLTLGDNSDFAKKVISKFKEYANYTHTDNLLDLVAQDNSSFEDSVYKTAWDHKKTLEEKLSQIHQAVEQILQGLNSSPTIDHGPTLLEIFRPLIEIEGEPEKTEMPRLRKELGSEGISLESSLRISITEYAKTVEVYYDSQTYKRVFEFNPNYFQDLDTLMFELKSPGLPEREMLTIRYLQKQLNFKKFHFRLDRNVKAGEFAKGMASFFWNPSRFEELRFDISEPKASLAEFSIFFNDAVSQMDNLTCLRLNLYNTKTGDEGILLLARNVLPNLKKLNTFDLNISQTKVKEDALLELIKNIPRLKVLRLQLEGVRASDREVSAIAELLKDSNDIKVLTVFISRTQCTDLSIQALFDNIPETVQDLCLGFQETGITPACVKNFLQFKAPYLNSLRIFNIRVDDESSKKKLSSWWDDLIKKKIEEEKEAMGTSKSLAQSTNTKSGLFGSSPSGGGGLFTEKQPEKVQNGGDPFSRPSGSSLFSRSSGGGGGGHGLFGGPRPGDHLFSRSRLDGGKSFFGKSLEGNNAGNENRPSRGCLFN